MRWMALGLIPILFCLAMCFGGAILAFFGLRHVSDRMSSERDDTYTRV
jgi:hypothetical protein